MYLGRAVSVVSIGTWYTGTASCSLSIENYVLNDSKGVFTMRGDAVRHAMEHAEPELAKAIWKDLMTPKPSKDEHRRQLVAEFEQRVLKVRRDA